MDEEIVTPSVNLLTSIRSVGYSFDAAIADLVDNSITAHAHTIEVDVDVVRGDYVAVLDDGDGMGPGETREALRLASTFSDLEVNGLGRFGLGLKTASLSQARSLTVVSKRNGQITGVRWDLDHVRRSQTWSLLILDEKSIVALPLWNKLDGRDSGTLVVWHTLDLLLGDATNPGAFLSEKLKGLRESLSLVFHRFLSRGQVGLTVFVNGIKVLPKDPFLSSNPKTQISPLEVIPMAGAAVSLIAYTLPHPSNLTADERRRDDLSAGMRESQGFYVYRNRRLISHGHWYGMARMSELSKQTRIQVDVPSTLDSLWQLDVKKSRAEPPASFKIHLRRLIEPILAGGRRVHTFRGRAERVEKTHVWNKIVERDGFRYAVNLENPTVSAVLALLPPEAAGRVEKLFETIAENYPLLDVYQEMAGSNQPTRVHVERAVIVERLQEIFESGVLGTDRVFVATALRLVEPFDGVDELDQLVLEVWGEDDSIK